MERTRCAVFIFWTPGSLVQLTWELTDGGLSPNSLYSRILNLELTLLLSNVGFQHFVSYVSLVFGLRLRRLAS